ncbi:glycosyltransferase family 4 protein [Flavobacterium flavigenum]|uniref:glycosyltransferase family 4 protein n=1 Tax=Flavobacterium flavigenum TaxID=3003258 RepID=UPI0022AC59B1|nr:glycosyltransferase family 4 protein [Flavobacterium flavigenum]
MKILYITSVVSTSGGVEKILAQKSDYFVENGNYEISIIYNEVLERQTFYQFNEKVKLNNLRLNKKSLFYVFKFRKTVKKIINNYCPEIIVVSDNGLKGFLIPLFIKTKVPVLLEVHGSKTEIINRKHSLLRFLKRKIHLLIKTFAITKFDRVIFLSKKSAAEWNFYKAKIIPNSLWFEPNLQSSLTSKVAIAIGRHSYEKGLDRLLPIWKEVSKQNPDWKLKIYGDFTEDTTFLKNEIDKLQLQDIVDLLLPVKDIEKVYEEASVFLMTSRFEGFGLALLEAMSFGLAVISFDCPIGPGNLIENNVDGILIPDNDSELYIKRLDFLIKNKELQNQLAKNAVKKASAFSKIEIMDLWEELFKEVLSR